LEESALAVTPTRLVMLSLLAAVLATTSACDGSGEPLSKDQYRATADAICAETNAALEQIADPTSAADIVDALDDAEPLVEKQLTQLKALSPPEGLADHHDDAVMLLEEQLDVTGSVKARIEEGESPFDVVNDVVSRLQEIDMKADAAASALGLTVCGQQDTA